MIHCSFSKEKKRKKKVCKNLDQMNFCFLITKRTKSCKKCQLWSILQAGEMALSWALRGMEQTPPGIWCHSMAVIQTGSCLSAMVGKMLKVQNVSLISFNVWIRLYGGFFYLVSVMQKNVTFLFKSMPSRKCGVTQQPAGAQLGARRPKPSSCCNWLRAKRTALPHWR